MTTTTPPGLSVPTVVLPPAAKPSPAPRRGSYGADLSRPAPDMGYVPGLDGIRALAVIGVLLFHGGNPWLPGGFLGVDLFFVLSGFLITTILLQQLQWRGKIDFGRFYRGRARRLLPALIAVLALSAVLVATVARDGASQFREHVIPSLFFFANWSFIVDDQSYFEAIGRPSVLQHLWSLAVEEQFYLLWPLLLLFLFRRGGRVGVARAALVIALLSTLAMAVFSVLWNVPADGDASRLYMGTDTHCMSLLVGAALAAVFRPGALPKQLPPLRAAALSLVGLAATAGVIASFAWVTETSNWLYRGGFILVALASAVMIAVVAHPAAWLGALFALAPLRWIGVRSYGIYLYHWPIFVVTRPDLDLPFGGTPAFLVSVGLTLLVADASYRYLEMPIRNGTWSATWHRWRDEGVLGPKLVRIVPVAALTAAAVTFAVMTAPAPDGREYLGGRTEIGAGPLVATGEAAAAAEAAGEAADVAKAQAAESEAAAAALAAKYGPVAVTDPISVVGDSVTVGAVDAFPAAIPGAVADGEVSRMPEAVFQRIRERAAAGVLGQAVVIQTGTNGLVTEPELRALLDELSGTQRVVLVTTAGTETWQVGSNDVIRAVAGSYPNVRVADWASASAGRGDLVVYDGVHLSEAGKPVYASLLVQALTSP